MQVFTTVPFSYWQPMAFLSHMVDVQLFGVDAGVDHLMSVVWHCGNAALLFLALFRLTGAMQWEPVAWIASRKDLVSAFFIIAALWAYAAAFPLDLSRICVGLMAKPGIIGFPLLLLLLDFWPLQKTKWKAAAIEKIPLFALSAVSVMITLSSIGYSGRLAADGHISAKDIPAAVKALNLLGQYLPKFLWPDRLSASYITEHLSAAWISCLVGIGISVAAIRFGSGFWSCWRLPPDSSWRIDSATCRLSGCRSLWCGA